MVQVALTYNYVYFGADGPHERRPVRSAGGPGGFTLIQEKSGGTLQTGDQFQIGIPLPQTQQVGTATYNFAFVNVSGGTPSGSQVSFDYLNPPPFVTVDTAPIVVLAVYVPPAGNGGGSGSGATIDSFNETSGSLFNDIFVSVAPDPGGGQTSEANNMGFVVTTTSQEVITALSPTSSEVVFDLWDMLEAPAPSTPPKFSVSGKNLTVGEGTSVIALAFYKAPPVPPPPTAQQVCNQTAQSLQQIITNRGPLLLVAQFAGIKASLEKCVSEGFLTQAFVNNLLTEYANIGESRNPPPVVGPPKV
jgi:hypothetical protein